ncbi:MAG: hypothetical protein U0271_33735 [Polyangiaceae bacterium]
MSDQENPRTQKNSPLALTKTKFGSKAKLVEAVKAFTTEDLWVGRTNADRGGDKGLARVSNAKLLRLHAIFTEVKEKFGTREKLISTVLELEGRAKDEGYKKRLAEYPVPRLYDHYKSAAKRAKRAAASSATSSSAT